MGGKKVEESKRSRKEDITGFNRRNGAKNERKKAVDP